MRPGQAADRRSLLLICMAVTAVSAPAAQAQPAWGSWTSWGDQGDGSYRNPIAPADYSDLDAILSGRRPAIKGVVE